MENFRFKDFPLTSFGRIRASLDDGSPLSNADVRTLLDYCAVSRARELLTKLNIASGIYKGNPEIRSACKELNASIMEMEEAEGEVATAQKELQATIDNPFGSIKIKDKKVLMKMKAVEEWMNVKNQCSTVLDEVYLRYHDLLASYNDEDKASASSSVVSAPKSLALPPPPKQDLDACQNSSNQASASAHKKMLCANEEIGCSNHVRCRNGCCVLRIYDYASDNSDDSDGGCSFRYPRRISSSHPCSKSERRPHSGARCHAGKST